jgi:hypothetical protein
LAQITPADLVHALDGAPEQGPRPRLAELLEQSLLAQRVAGEHEAAIAPGRAVADLLAFQQHHVMQPSLGQAQRGVEPGEAAADHRHARLLPALERRMRLVRRSRGAVVGHGGRRRHGLGPCRVANEHIAGM